MKKFLFLPFLIAGFYVASKLCVSATDGFTILHITSNLPRAQNSEPLSEGLKPLLSQKFRYLGSGGQCYAFASEDDQIVLKFFKHHLRQPPSWIPLNLYQKRADTLQQKRARDFNSYKIASELLSEETGLLYLHLNKSNHLRTRVTIVDKIGIAHTLDLDNYEFILQRKAELVYPHIDNLVRKGDVEGAKTAISSLISLLASRSKKGVYDEDPRPHRNVGFIGNQAILIDIGRFKKDESRKAPAVYQKDVLKITQRFQEWIRQEHPELLSHLNSELEKI